MAPKPNFTCTSADTSEVPSTIQCVQGNLRRSHQSQVNLLLDILNKNVYKNGIDVIFVTEPFTILKENSLTDVPDNVFNVFAQRGGRTALVTKNMCTWKVPQYCSKDVTVCQTKLNNRLTYLVSLYLNIKVHGLPNKFKELIRNRGDYDILIGTDSNLHSTVWNCPSTNKLGELLEQFLIDNNLSCSNVGNNPTFINGSGYFTIIDLTLAKYRLSQRVSNWQVEQVLHSSDHYRVLFTINNCPNFRIPPAETWNYHKGMWPNFKSQLELGLKHWTCPRFWTDVTIEQKLTLITDEVNKALELSCPKKHCKQKYKFPTWWNQNISKLRAKMHFLANKKSPEGKNAYRTLRREYKNAIAIAKDDGWKKFTSKIVNPSDVSKLIRSFNNNKNNALGLLKNEHGEYCNNPEDSLSILLNKFFPGHTEVPDTDTLEWVRVRNNKLDNTFTIKQIKNAFHCMGSFKGAGPDGIKPIVMKHFGPIALRCISFVFKAIYSTGYIPVDLRKSRVVFISKRPARFSEHMVLLCKWFPTKIMHSVFRSKPHCVFNLSDQFTTGSSESEGQA